MGWSEVIREVWLDDLIGRPCGDGGRFRRPWLFRKVGVGVRSNFFFCYGYVEVLEHFFRFFYKVG